MGARAPAAADALRHARDPLPAWPGRVRGVGGRAVLERGQRRVAIERRHHVTLCWGCWRAAAAALRVSGALWVELEEAGSEQSGILFPHGWGPSCPQRCFF